MIVHSLTLVATSRQTILGQRTACGGICHHFQLHPFRRNPLTPAPAIKLHPMDDFHEWKAEMRGYDAARVDLKLATPQQIQAQNAAIPTPLGGNRIIRHAPYARAIWGRRSA